MDFPPIGTAAPAIAAAFFASLVEVVEAFTIVLAVAAVRGARPAIFGLAAGLLCLVIIVGVLGPVLDQVPLRLLQFFVGVLLLLFGMRWLRKAVLRAAGFIPLHDEEKAFYEEATVLEDVARRQRARADWIAALAAFKAVLLEGIEVVFIVIAVGAGRNLLVPASVGALAACALVLAIGVVVHQPLSRVPENTLKFGVGVMLSSFGVFWVGEGLGLKWPGSDAAILGFALVFLALALGLVARRRRTAGDVDA